MICPCAPFLFFSDSVWCLLDCPHFLLLCVPYSSPQSVFPLCPLPLSNTFLSATSQVRCPCLRCSLSRWCIFLPPRVCLPPLQSGLLYMYLWPLLIISHSPAHYSLLMVATASPVRRTPSAAGSSLSSSDIWSITLGSGCRPNVGMGLRFVCCPIRPFVRGIPPAAAIVYADVGWVVAIWSLFFLCGQVWYMCSAAPHL
jgi:hypothetical protein